jgi:hypothetical protein
MIGTKIAQILDSPYASFGKPEITIRPRVSNRTMVSRLQIKADYAAGEQTG